MSRDVNETKFSFKAFRNLKKGLGKFDAVVECNELAILEFLKNLKASQDQEKFIQNLSQKHEIRIDTVKVDLFSSRIRLFYILSVMQQSEQFLMNLERNIKLIIRLGQTRKTEKLILILYFVTFFLQKFVV